LLVVVGVTLSEQLHTLGVKYYHGMDAKQH